MTAAFSDGRTSAITSSMPTSAATARAVVSLSPVSSTGRRPSARSEATASADVGLTVSATTSSPRTAPSQATATAVRPCDSAASPGRLELGGQRERAVGQERRPSDLHAATADDALDAEALVVGEARERGQRAERVAGGARDRLRDRVLGGVLERAGHAEHRVAVLAGRRHDVDEAHAAGRDRAGLVEHDRVGPAGRLEDLRALDQQPELGAAAGADEQRGRRREAERARAGDDQHGDGGGERERQVLAGADPEAERGHRDADHDRHEDARDAVGEPLDRRLAALRVGHQLARSGPARCRRRPWWRARPGGRRRSPTRPRPHRPAASRPAPTRRSAATGRRRWCPPRRRRRSPPSRRGGRRSGRRRPAPRSRSGARRRRCRAPPRPWRRARAGR